MLSVKTRGRFNTLLDAITLTAANDDPAIILVSSTDDPVVVTRHAFSRQVQNTANSMSALGIRPRDLVVIAHTQDLESIYSFWGGTRHRCNPLNVSDPDRQAGPGYLHA